MVQKYIKSGGVAGLAAFIPLTLLGVYLQFAWASYQSLGSIGAAIAAPIWLAITSPIWLLLGVGDKHALLGLFLHVLLIAMVGAALGSVMIALAINRAAKNRS